MAKRVAAALCFLSLAACDEAMTTTSAELDMGLPDPAVAACMSAVAQRSGTGIVAPTQVESRLAGTIVSLGVGEERVPWECHVDQSGTVVAVAPASGVG